jgi:hypothetical protein
VKKTKPAPKQSLVPYQLKPERRDLITALAAMSEAELREVVRAGFLNIRINVEVVAAAVQRLEAMGADLSDMSEYKSVLRYLRHIAGGRLAPKAYLAFQGQATHLLALLELPLPDQEELAAGKKLKVIIDNNTQKIVDMPLADVPSAAIHRLIKDGRVRTPEEQLLALQSARSKPKVSGRKREWHYKTYYDVEKNVIKKGRETIALDEIGEVVADARGEDSPPPADLHDEYVQAKVRLYPDEFKKLTERCRNEGRDLSDVFRQAMRAHGWI